VRGFKENKSRMTRNISRAAAISGKPETAQQISEKQE
jgi:hypothetical protein